MQNVRGRVALGLSAVVLFAGAGLGPARLKTMGVGEVQRGMRGHGLTVFEGTEPARFDVEVIDVLHNFRPDQDLVLIKTPHPILDHAGSVAGMSGSPIYLDGRLIGAYAYGWSFGKDPIAGVTPIANMLRELDRPLLSPRKPLGAPLPLARAEARRGGYRGGERRDAWFGLDRHVAARAKRDTAPHGFVPAATPLLVGGLTPSVAQLLRERLAPLGVEVLEATGGGVGKPPGTPQRFVDGGAMAVTLVRGDVQATGVGTVTYVDGKRAVAFGHPMIDAGETSLPTATARVLHVLASERSSFKIAESVAPLGALVHDRQAAVVVDASEPAHTVPVDVRLEGLPGIPRTHWRVEVADHRLLTPALVMTAVASALGGAVNDNAEMMYEAESVVTLGKYGPQRVLDQGFTGAGMGHPMALSRLRVFDLLEVAYDNPFERVPVERVEVRIKLRVGRDVTQILGAQLAQGELDPGEPARVVLSLRKLDGPVQQRIVEVPLPATLAGEQIELELAAGDQVALPEPLPTSLPDILTSVRTGLPNTTLGVTLSRKGRGLSLAGQVVRNLPGSALDALAATRDTTRSATFTQQRHLVLPLGSVLVGSAKLGLTIRKERR
ncbi:MAG: SpoIVB peptidase S55 domain-containing protein [Polyangiales bacterium]